MRLFILYNLQLEIINFLCKTCVKQIVTSNRMTTYKIKTTSWVLWISTLMTTLFGGIVLAFKLLPKDYTVLMVAIVLIMVAAFFLQRFTSLGIVIVNLTDKEISINWIKQYIFHNRPNREIPLSDIESYKYQPDQNFDLFKLTLKDGSEIRLWHFTFTSGDDFHKLAMDFSQIVIKHNKERTKKSKTEELGQSGVGIKRANTIFESEFAPFLAAFAILIIVAVPLILYFRSADTSKNPFALLAPMAGAIFFLIQFYKYRRTRNNEQ